MYGVENVILMFHDTKTEHPSNKKFKEDICNFLGAEYIEVSDGRDLWQVIVDNHTLPSCFIPLCTRIMKQEQGMKFLKTLKEPYILYNGFGVHEGHRTSGSIKACSKKNIIVKSPLQEYNIPDDKVMRIIKDEWKITIPVMYGQGFMHSNCIICWKAGKNNHFKLAWQYYPEEIEKAIWMEKKISDITGKKHTIFNLKRKNKITGEKDTILTPLSEIVKIWEDSPPAIPELYKPHVDVWEQIDMFREVEI